MRTYLNRTIQSVRRHQGFLRFGSTSILSSVSNLAAGVLMLRWIPPELMGLWQTVLFAMALCDIAKFGILNGMNRELPYRMGRGETESAYRAVATASAFMLISMVVGATIFAGFTVYYWSHGPLIRMALIAGGLAWCAAYYGQHVQATCRGHDDFAKVSRVQLFDGIVALLSLVLVWKFGFIGLCVRSVLQAGSSALLLHIIRPIRRRPSFDLDLLRELLKSGLPAFAASYLFSLGQNAERAVLLSTSSIAVVGLFAPIYALQTAMLMLPNAALTYGFPKLSFAHGKQASNKELWSICVRLTLGGVAATAFIACVGLFAMPWMVRHVFPAYTQSLAGLQWALLASIFLAVRPMGMALGVLRSWGWHFAWVVVFVASKWSFCSFFAQRMNPISGVALGGFVSAVATAAVMTVGAYRATHAEQHT